MPRKTPDAVFEKVFASGWAAPHLTVIWHAGEPLVLPVAFYHEAFARIEKHAAAATWRCGMPSRPTAC